MSRFSLVVSFILLANLLPACGSGLTPPPDGGGALLDSLQSDAIGEISVPQPDTVGGEVSEPAVCDPDPAGVPPRPLWSQFNDPDPGVAPDSPYPDYETITNNLDIRSLTLLISTLTKASNRLDEAKTGLAELDLDPNSAPTAEQLADSLLGGLPGHCLCNGCDPGALFNSAWEMVETTAHAAIHGCVCQAPAPTGKDICPNAGDPNCQDIPSLLEVLQGLEQDVMVATKTHGQQLLDDMHSAISTGIPPGQTKTLGQLIRESVYSRLDDAYQACGHSTSFQQDLQTNPNDPSIVGLVTAVEDYITATQAFADTITQTIDTAVSDFIGPNSQLMQIWDDLKAIWDAVKAIGDGKGLFVYWGDVYDAVQTIIDDVEPLVEQYKGTVETVKTSWDAWVSAAQNLGNELDNFQGFGDLRNTVITFVQCNGNTQQIFDDFVAGVRADLQHTVAVPFRDWLVDRLESLRDELGDIATQAGQDYGQAVLAPLRDFIDDGLMGCHLYGDRGICKDFCNGDGDFSVDYGGVLMWVPTDVFHDPTKITQNMTPAQWVQAALFVLKQIGWLDEVLADDDNSGTPDIIEGIGNALGALSNVLSDLADALAFLQEAMEYVDRFTEGYHLGGYDKQRPDLHMCIGWAGHAAFSQMGGLGGETVSIGARYVAHNLSKKHRFQVRSGGFAISFKGRGLSLAPTLEINAQIDGWRMWDADHPFGLPFGNLNLNTDDIERYDVFHLVEPSDLSGLADGSGNITFGVRDLFPAGYTDGQGLDHTWPRLENPVPYEAENTAVVSAGFNFDISIKDGPKEWKLADIPIYPPYVTAMLFFSLDAGVEWMHDTNGFFPDIIDAINANLPSAEQLNFPDDFQRETHAMQAPDLSADNGTEAFVTPGLKLAVNAGFKVWKVRFGILAGLRLDVKLSPKGLGGVIDANSALVDVLTKSNPIEDGPCQPVLVSETTYGCDNVTFVDDKGTAITDDDEPLSTGDYACEPDDKPNSCCITVECIAGAEDFDKCVQQLDEWELTHPLIICVDEWVGMSESLCEGLAYVTPETVEPVLEGWPDGLFASIKDALVELVQYMPVEVATQWNTEGCADSSTCETEHTTGYLTVTTQSECEKWGYCTYDDGTVVHDVTAEQCESQSRCVTAYTQGAGGDVSLLLAEPGLSWSSFSLADGMNLSGNADWVAYNERLAGAVAATLDQQECQSKSWCVGFTYADANAMVAEGYSPAAGLPRFAAGDAVAAEEFPIMFVGATVDQSGVQVCPYGLDHDGATFDDITAATGNRTSPPRAIAFIWDDTARPGVFQPYACQPHTETTAAGWIGSGCHPLQTGFPTACGCAEDADCASGETCDPETGRCLFNGAVFSCLCTTAADCTSGRDCVDGACLKPCTADADCTTGGLVSSNVVVPGFVCDAGYCRPESTVPTAEAVLSGLQNVTAPLHAIASYAMSMFEFLTTLTFDIELSAEFKLLGKVRKWKLFSWSKAWDLFSSMKTWYQPGLEARYQSECSDSPDQLVTNRFPHARTVGDIDPVDQAMDGVAGNFCPEVCRYPADPAFFAGYTQYTRPEDVPTGNAGDVDDFLDWCKAEMPTTVEDPEPTGTTDITTGVVDTFQWGHDIGFDLWASHQICIDGQLWTEYLSDFISGSGSGGLAAATCEYVNPYDGSVHTFPCGELTEGVLRAWGCLDTDANVFADALRLLPAAVAWYRGISPFPLYVNDPNTGAQVFDLERLFRESLFDPSNASAGTVLDLDADDLKPEVAGYTPFGVPVAYYWLVQVDRCAEAHFNDPMERVCTCSTDQDCALLPVGNVDLTRRCQSGVCQEERMMIERPGATSASTSGSYWADMMCPVVTVQFGTPEPCCGDGVVEQSTHPIGPGGLTYFEECDDGNLVPGDGCDEYCRSEEGTGACCLPTGTCSLRSQAFCDNDGGTYHGDGSRCDDVDCPQPTGACCMPDGTCVQVTADGCTGEGGTFQGVGVACDTVDCPDPDPRGACCDGLGNCLVEPLSECLSHSGTFMGAGVGCNEVTCPVPDPTGACCFEDGTCAVDTSANCETAGGTYQSDDVTCEAADCPQPPATGACCFADGSCSVATPDECDTLGGTYQGDDVTCRAANCPQPPATGACCFTDGSCTVDTSANCEAARGTYQGDDVTCEAARCPQPPATGACCLSDMCSIETAEDCRAAGGTYAGDDVTCEAGCPGACCLPDYSCIETPQTSCDRALGTFHGIGVPCATVECRAVEPTGACCLQDGSCVPATQTACEAERGSYQGDDVTCASVDCPTTGACCLPDGTCVELTVLACDVAAGSHHGDGTICDEVVCRVATP